MFLVLQKGIDVAGAGGQFWIFALAADGQMVYKYWDGVAWQPSQTGWNSLGGNFIGPPSCSVRQFTSAGSGAQIDVVAVGEVQGKKVHLASEALFHRFWDGSNWNPGNNWDQLVELNQGNFSIKFAPHPVAIAGFDAGPNLADVVAVGSDGQAYHNYLSGPSSNPGWQAWENLGGNIASAPAVAGMEFAFNLPGQVLSVFVIDAAGHAFYKYTDGSGWQPSQTTWNHLDDSEVLYNIAAAGTNDVRLDVLGTAGPLKDGRLVHKTYVHSGNAFAWTPSQSWETVTNDDFQEGRPIIVETGAPLSRVDVFWGRWHNYLPVYQGSWLPQWESVGRSEWSPCMPAAAAVYNAPDQVNLHVVGIGGGAGGMWHMFSNGSGWQPTGTEDLGSPSGGFLLPGYGIIQ